MGSTEVRPAVGWLDWMVEKMGNGSENEHGKKRQSRWKVISLSLSVFHALG